jgi:hypothetical protein
LRSNASTSNKRHCSFSTKWAAVNLWYDARVHRRLQRRNIVELAAVVLGLAALGGLTLAGIRLLGTPRPPTWMALGHGAAAVTGVALLSYAAWATGVPGLAQVALGLFVLAAFGGAVIFFGFHLRDRPLPIPLVIGHGLIAITALSLLLLSIFGIA